MADNFPMLVRGIANDGAIKKNKYYVASNYGKVGAEPLPRTDRLQLDGMHFSTDPTSTVRKAGWAKGCFKIIHQQK